MATLSEDTHTLRARCHCGLASYTVKIAKGLLPLKSAICSCTSCRRATGGLFATFAVIPSLPVPDVTHLSSYASSSGLNRIFCPRCGCSVLNREADGWEFTSGVLEGPVEGLLDRQALFANDSVDGGGYVWLPKMNNAGREIKHHGGHRDSELVDVKEMRRKFDAKSTAGSAPNEGAEDDKLPVRCHCGAFQCYITRPSAEMPEPTSGRGKWWLAKDERRYKAALDACIACRKVTGFELNWWAFIPASNFVSPDGSPLDPENHPALKHYSSSAGVQRDFCGTCGASVFFRKELRNPQVWDIAAGLLVSAGARAEDWLMWNGLDFEDFALDPNFVSGIAEALKTELSTD